MSQETRRRRGIYNSFDWVTFGLFALLLLVSVIVMSTASANAMSDDSGYYLRRHLFMIAVGFGVFVAVTLFDYRRYKDFLTQGYIIVCVMLLITLIFGTGDGANRWIFGVQPSEAAKVAMISGAALCGSGCPEGPAPGAHRCRGWLWRHRRWRWCWLRHDGGSCR